MNDILSIVVADQRFSTEKKLTVLLLFYRSHILNYGIKVKST